MKILHLVFIVSMLFIANAHADKPNVIFILIDDMGINEKREAHWFLSPNSITPSN